MGISTFKVDFKFVKLAALNLTSTQKISLAYRYALKKTEIPNWQAAIIFSQEVAPWATWHCKSIAQSCQLLNPKFDVVEKLLVEPYNTLSLGHTAYKWG